MLLKPLFLEAASYRRLELELEAPQVHACLFLRKLLCFLSEAIVQVEAQHLLTYAQQQQRGKGVDVFRRAEHRNRCLPLRDRRHTASST